MYRAYRTDSGTTTTKWFGVFSNPIWIRLNEDGDIVECPEKDATGVRLIGCYTPSQDGMYALKGSSQVDAFFDRDDCIGEVAITDVGTGTADVITEATLSSHSLTDSMLQGADRIPITDASARTSGYVMLGNLSSFVRSQLGGGLAPYVLARVTEEGWGNICEVVAINGNTIISAGEPYLVNNSQQEWYISLPSYGQWTLKATCLDGSILAHRVTLNNINRTETWYFTNSDFLPELGRDGGLNAYTWDEINKISASGLASTYFNIGDTHAVALNGTVGTLALDTTLYAYILDFEHDKSYESDVVPSGITFGTFKTAESGGVDVAIADSMYNTSIDGTKNFNMNHWGNFNHGGWKGCDLRYDILGSTDQAPSGYGEAVAEGRTGYNASPTTASNPVPNTLMAALPADLRAVMKPMYIYSDNIGGGTGNNPNNVTPSTDYLPLLDEYEISGEISYQAYHFIPKKMYAYYSNGNSKVKYRHLSTGSDVHWWERSPACSDDANFALVSNNGEKSCSSANYSIGIAPIFKV